jgi:hypothetical protein
MRRDLSLVKHLLDMVQAHADHSGIYLIDLVPKWEGASGNPDKALTEDQLVYLLNRCAEAGYLSIGSGNLIQMTWAGHDYLDSVTLTHSK